MVQCVVQILCCSCCIFSILKPFTILGLAYCVNDTAVIAQRCWNFSSWYTALCVVQEFQETVDASAADFLKFNHVNFLARFLLYFICHLLVKTVRAAGW